MVMWIINDSREPQSDVIDKFEGEYFFLSNFYPSPVVYDGVRYHTVEHAYQAAKTLVHKERIQIQKATSPAQAKKLGKKVLLRPDWDDIKVRVMRGLLEQKFAFGTEESKMLDRTGCRVLIEGNTWNDTFWGVCRGEGQNTLGKLLMDIRTSRALNPLDASSSLLPQ